MFKQPLCFATAKTPALMTMSPEALKTKETTSLLAKTMAHYYMNQNKNRSSFVTLMAMAKYFRYDEYYCKRIKVKDYKLLPDIFYNHVNYKLFSLNDPKFKELMDVAWEKEKQTILLTNDDNPMLSQDPRLLSEFKKTLAHRMLPGYDLTKEIDEIFQNSEKYDQGALEEFFVSLKLSKKMKPVELADFINQKYITPYKVIENKEEFINISGENETKIVKEYVYDKVVDANNVNPEIFSNPEVFQLTTAFATLAPVESLEKLIMHLQENITKSFLDEKRLLLLTTVLNRLTHEIRAHYAIFKKARKVDLYDPVKFKHYRKIMPPHQRSEMIRDVELAEKFRTQIIANIFFNPDLSVKVVQDYFKNNDILHSNDLNKHKEILRAKFPSVLKNPHEFYGFKKIKQPYEEEDPYCVTHRHLGGKKSAFDH